MNTLNVINSHVKATREIDNYISLAEMKSRLNSNVGCNESIDLRKLCNCYESLLSEKVKAKSCKQVGALAKRKGFRSGSSLIKSAQSLSQQISFSGAGFVEEVSK